MPGEIPRASLSRDQWIAFASHENRLSPACPAGDRIGPEAAWGYRHRSTRFPGQVANTPSAGPNLSPRMGLTAGNPLLCNGLHGGTEVMVYHLKRLTGTL